MLRRISWELKDWSSSWKLCARVALARRRCPVCGCGAAHLHVCNVLDVLGVGLGAGHVVGRAH
eukprot:scaffold116408_cov29-Tisochrysis_lutea.AAC.1